MDKKVVLVGAGSASFGPSTISDLFLSEILTGSTIVLHDIDKNKLEMMYELCLKENEMRNNKFTIQRTTKRKMVCVPAHPQTAISRRAHCGAATGRTH